MSTNTKLAEALREIADAHIPDMPSAWNDPSSWAERQHARLRRIAREALRQYEQAKPAEPVASLMTNIQSGDVEVVWNDDGFDRELWHETPLYADPVEQAAKAVPAGFVLVPVEPTLEMLTAAGREDDKAFIDGMPHGATAADTWAAMLAAAPTPPAPDCED